MKEALVIFQILTACLLMAAILLQAKGTGLGQAWGSGGEFYGSRRGVEKMLLRATIALAVAFFFISSVLAIV